VQAEKERTIEGVWWTPGERERSYGTLVVERRALTLTLRDSIRSFGAASNGFSVLHGESLDGKPLTLLDAFTIHRREWPTTEHNIERLSAGTLLIGAEVAAADELVFARAVFRLRGLREWMSTSSPGLDGRRSALNPRQLFAPPRPPRGLRACLRHWRERWSRRRRGREHPLVVSIDGARLTFGFTREAGGTPFRDVTGYDAEVIVELDEAAPLPEWSERWLRPLLDLLVFANREQCVVGSFVAVIHDPALAEAVGPAIRVAAPDSVWARHEIEIVRPDPVDLRERQIEPFRHLLLPLAAFRDRAEQLLPLWFDIHRKLGGAAAFFFGTLNVGRIYQENRLLNLLAFAEGYHRTFFDAPPFTHEVHDELVNRMLATLDDSTQRDHYRARLRYANSQSQRQRLGELIDRAGDAVPELRPRLTKLRHELVDTRNQYTHFGEPGPNVLAPEDLHGRVDRLLLVLEVNLLRDLGVEDALIPKLVAQAYQERIP
jgi:ApeA N-terminal domain 1